MSVGAFTDDKLPIQCELCGSPLRWVAPRRALCCTKCDNYYSITIHNPEDYVTTVHSMDESIAPSTPLYPDGVWFHEVTQNQAQKILKRYLKRKWYTYFYAIPLKRLPIKPMYVPYWGINSKAISQWNAEVLQQLISSEKNAKGKRNSKWEKIKGERTDTYTNILIPANHRVPARVSEKLTAPVTLKDTFPFHPAYTVGWNLLPTDMSSDEAFEMARPIIEEQQQQLCELDIPGQGYQDLRVSTKTTQETYKLLLLPVWSCTFSIRKRPFRFFISTLDGNTIQDIYPEMSTLMFSLITIGAVLGGLIGLFAYLS